MPYCDNCGNELLESSKFCPECGNTIKSKDGERKISYEGEIHKCPNCGEVLNSFVSNCPSCGYEIRGIASTNSIKDFFEKLESASSEKAKMEIIRNFPIPNAKEDILEFMIHAVTNIDADVDNLLVDAWVSKVEQAYQKAQIIFSKEKEFGYIETAYAKFKEKIDLRKRIVQKKDKQKVFSGIASVLPSAMFVTGWLVSIFILIPLCNMGLDNVGTNGYQLVLFLDLILGAVVIPFTFKCGSVIPKLIALVGMIACIIIMVLSDFKFLLINGIVCSVIVFVRMLFTKNKEKEIHLGFKTTAIVSIICIALSGVGYGIGNIIVYNNDLEVEQKKNETQSITYEWPSVGLSQYLPIPSTKYGEIQNDSEIQFNIVVYQVSFNDFQDYTQMCQEEKGFVINITKTDDVFYAYHAEKHELNIFYDAEEKTMEIFVNAPEKMSKIKWPSDGMAKNIPVPKSLVGKIQTDTSDSFSVDIADTNEKAFNEYVESCMKNGFTVDYVKEDGYFNALNEDGEELTLQLCVFDVMNIYITTSEGE